jgi:hypothetical protein
MNFRDRRLTEMRDRIVGWAILLAAFAFIGGMVLNISFGKTLNDFNNGSAQKITMSQFAN